MIISSTRNRMSKRGMTMSEVVIAISIIAFSIPLILAATGGAHRSLQAAEADTRSAWLVRDVQRRIMDEWSDAKPLSSPEMSFSFPSTATPEVAMELSYNLDGTLTSEGSDQAVFLVTVEAEPYLQSQDHTSTTSLALISIKIQHPAKSPPNKRKILTYQFVSPRDAIL